MSMLVDALLGSSVSGSSLPRVTRRSCWSASSAAGEAEAAGDSEAPVEAAGLSAAGVEAAGEALLVAPPQAVTIITPAASRPSSRLCINCFLRTGGYPMSPADTTVPMRFPCPPGRSRSWTGPRLPLDRVSGRAEAAARFGSVRCRYYPQHLVGCQPKPNERSYGGVDRPPHQSGHGVC